MERVNVKLQDFAVHHITDNTEHSEVVGKYKTCRVTNSITNIFNENTEY